MKELFELYWLFLRIGSVTFGGGYAMLPILQEELVVKRGWVTDEEILDYFAIGQVTPGIIAVNVSTFIGHKRKGILGGIMATLGFVTPSLIIIGLISGILEKFQENQIVKHAFAGIQVVVVALILNVTIDMYKKTVLDNLGLILCIGSFVGIAILKISPVIMILLAGVIGGIRYRNIIDVQRKD